MSKSHLQLRRLRNPIALIALGLTLAGCAASAPQLPPYVDAFTGIYNQSSAAVPADVPVAVRQPVGIIFSDNFEHYIAFARQTDAYWTSVVPTALTNNVARADTDPNYLGGRILAMLKGHYPSSEVVNDFQRATASGKRAVCLVDLRVKPMEPYGDRTTKVDLIVYIFDANMNPVSRVSGHGERYVPFGSGDAGFQVAIDAAVAELNTRLTTLTH
jgi:hypothetical protein